MGVAFAGKIAMDEFAHMFEGRNEAVEAWPDISLVERRQRAGEETSCVAVILRIGPRGSEAGLPPILEIGAGLMLGGV